MQEPPLKKFSQVWFDWDCLRVRTLSLALLILFQKVNSAVVKREYLKINKEYKLVIFSPYPTEAEDCLRF